MRFGERSTMRIMREARSGSDFVLKGVRTELGRVEREEVVFRSAVCWSQMLLSER